MAPKNTKINSKKVIKNGTNRIAKKTYTCTVCERGFSKLYHLKRHSSIHTGEKPFKCESCDTAYRENRALILHNLKVHNLQTPVKKHLKINHICPECKKQFRGNNDLTRHLRTHSDEKPFKCTTCGKGFCQESHLRIHIRKHTGERPYACTHCTLRVSCPSNFRTHQARCAKKVNPRITVRKNKICVNPTKFGIGKNSKNTSRPRIDKECDFCSYKCKSSVKLEIHLRVHTGDKPHICTVCKKGFARPDTLQIHMRIHSVKVKPFKCALCDKRFKEEKQLDSHKMNDVHIHIGQKMEEEQLHGAYENLPEIQCVSPATSDEEKACCSRTLVRNSTFCRNSTSKSHDEKPTELSDVDPEEERAKQWTSFLRIFNAKMGTQ